MRVELSSRGRVTRDSGGILGEVSDERALARARFAVAKDGRRAVVDLPRRSGGGGRGGGGMFDEGQPFLAHG